MVRFRAPLQLGCGSRPYAISTTSRRNHRHQHVRRHTPDVKFPQRSSRSSTGMHRHTAKPGPDPHLKKPDSTISTGPRHRHRPDANTSVKWAITISMSPVDWQYQRLADIRQAVKKLAAASWPSTNRFAVHPELVGKVIGTNPPVNPDRRPSPMWSSSSLALVRRPKTFPMSLGPDRRRGAEEPQRLRGFCRSSQASVDPVPPAVTGISAREHHGSGRFSHPDYGCQG